MRIDGRGGRYEMEGEVRGEGGCGRGVSDSRVGLARIFNTLVKQRQTASLGMKTINIFGGGREVGEEGERPQAEPVVGLSRWRRKVGRREKKSRFLGEVEARPQAEPGIIRT